MIKKLLILYLLGGAFSVWVVNQMAKSDRVQLAPSVYVKLFFGYPLLISERTTRWIDEGNLTLSASGKAARLSNG